MALPTLKVRVTSETGSAERGLDRVTDSLENTSTAADRAARSTRNVSRRMSQAARGSRVFQRGVQNAAFQVGDFAVQVGAGTDAMRAAALQLPQLLGGFGVFGAVLGAVSAIVLPLASAMKNISTEGGNITQVFGTLEPLAVSIAESMERVAGIIVSTSEVIVNNIDRILVIAATATAFFAGRWVAGFVAARIATSSLSAALVALRGALIRTGIGALIVGAGELVFQFTRLSKAVGGAGEAARLLFDVLRETFTRIKAQISLLINGFGQLGRNMQMFFLQALFNMSSSFVEFTQTVAQGLNNLFGTNLQGLSQTPIRETFVAPILEATEALKGLTGEEAKLQETLNAPFESIQRIRDLLAGMKEDGITLPDILGGGDGDDGGGAGKKLDEQLTKQEERIRDHFGRIRAITAGGLSDQLGGYGDYFNNLVAMTNTNNNRLLGIGKAFASAQALIDAWSAHNRVLADPTLPWFARIASAAQVLASGLGAVNAIRSVSGSTGGGGAAAGGAAAGGAAQAPLNVRVAGLDPNALFTGRFIGNLFDQLNDEAGDRGLSLTVTQ